MPPLTPGLFRQFATPEIEQEKQRTRLTRRKKVWREQTVFSIPKAVLTTHVGVSRRGASSVRAFRKRLQKRWGDEAAPNKKKKKKEKEIDKARILSALSVAVYSCLTSDQPPSCCSATCTSTSGPKRGSWSACKPSQAAA